MALTNLHDDLDALTYRAAEALEGDLRIRLEEYLTPILDDVVRKAAEDLRARLAVHLQSHYSLAGFEVSLCVDGVRQP